MPRLLCRDFIPSCTHKQPGRGRSASPRRCLLLALPCFALCHGTAASTGSHSRNRQLKWAGPFQSVIMHAGTSYVLITRSAAHFLQAIGWLWRTGAGEAWAWLRPHGSSACPTWTSSSSMRRCGAWSWVQACCSSEQAQPARWGGKVRVRCSSCSVRTEIFCKQGCGGGSRRPAGMRMLEEKEACCASEQTQAECPCSQMLCYEARGHKHYTAREGEGEHGSTASMQRTGTLTDPVAQTLHWEAGGKGSMASMQRNGMLPGPVTQA